MNEKFDKIDYKKNRLEEGQHPDSISSVMDLMNNYTGILISCENQQLDKNQLKEIIIKEIKIIKYLINEFIILNIYISEICSEKIHFQF